MKTTDININDTKNEVIAIKVTGVKVFSLRLKIAIWLFNLAGWIAPFQTKIEVDKE